jgi:Ca-activated chloride channel family protein
MRVRTTVLAAVLGMAVTSAAASRVPLVSTSTLPVPGRDDPGKTASAGDGGANATAGASFGPDGQDGPVKFDGRLGNATLAKGADGESYLLVTLHSGGEGDAKRASPPVHLSVVIDRSGSMKGARIENAIAAATGLVQQLRPRDSVSVVSFDTQSQVVVPPTNVDDATRPSILSAIRSIRVGGDTCISCGLEEGMHQMRERDSSGTTPSGEVRRMVLLSDGATNHGIRDVAGLRALAARLRDAGCAISTVGLDVDFDEKVMSAIATESNGNHYFVRDASNLASIFGSELDAVESTVANDVDLNVDLAPGVEVEEVIDRAFTRGTGPNGPRISVPFGAIRAGEDKTFIARVHVRSDVPGIEPVAQLALHYRDIAAAKDRDATAALSVTIGDATAALDPLVAVRLDRARTAATLIEANDLFASGQVDQANRLLAAQKAKVDDEKKVVLAHRALSPAFFGGSSGGGSGSGGVGHSASGDLSGADKDLDRQEAALSSASSAFSPRASATGVPQAAPAPASEAGKAARKQNTANAGPLKF